MRHQMLRARVKGPRLVGTYTQTYEGDGGNQTLSLTSLTGGIDSQPSEGDVVVVGYVAASNGVQTTGPATGGWTEVIDTQNTTDTYDSAASIFYKVQTGTPDTSVSLDGSATGMGMTACVHVWRGIDQVTPIDVDSEAANGNNSADANPPSITPVTAGAVVIAFGGGAHSSTERYFTSSDLSNFVEDCPSATANYNATGGMGNIIWESGAVDPAAFTLVVGGGAAASWCAGTIALRPE